MAEAMAKAKVVREMFSNYQPLEGTENGRDQGMLQSLGKGSLTISLQKAQRMVETKGKATVIRERFSNYQPLEGTENGRDRGKGCKHQGKVPQISALEGKENVRDHGKGYSRQRKVP